MRTEPVVARGAAINLMGSLAGVLDPLLLAVLSWALGAQPLGRYVLATTYVAILLRLCVLGLDRGLLRQVPIALERQDTGALASAIGTALRVALGLSLIGAAAVGLLAESFAGDGAWLGWMALTVPLQALATVGLFALRGRSNMVAFVTVRNALTPALILLVALPAIALGAGERGLIAGYLAAQLGAATLALGWLRRGFPRLSATALLRAPRDRALLRFALPQGISELLNLLLARSDIVMIGFFFPHDPELVAAYAIASMLASVPKKVRQGFDHSAAPVLAAAIGRGDRIALGTTYAQVGRWVFALWIPVAGALSLTAPLLLSAFGPDYARHAAVVPILIAGRAINAAAGPAQTALLMAGRARLELFNVAAINALNVAANALLIPRLGMVGAALATAGAIACFGGLRVVQVRGLLGVGPAPGATLRLVLALGAALLPALALLGDARTPLAHGLAALVFLAAYPLALWTAGIREELSALGRWLRRTGATAGGV